MKKIVSILLIINLFITFVVHAEEASQLDIQYNYTEEKFLVTAHIPEFMGEGNVMFMMIGKNENGNEDILYMTENPGVQDIQFVVDKGNLDKYNQIYGKISGTYFDTKTIVAPQPCRVTLNLENGIYAYISASGGATYDARYNKTIYLAENETADITLCAEEDYTISSLIFNGEEVSENTIHAIGIQQEQTIKAVSQDIATEKNIYKVSENTKPGDCFTIFGYNIDADKKITAKNLSDNTEYVIETVNSDGTGDYVSAVLPDAAAAGQYELTVTANGSSETIIMNQSRPQWLENTTVAHNNYIRIFGECMDPSEYGAEIMPSVKLIGVDGNEYYPIIIDKTPFYIGFKVEESIPAGEYRILTSNGNNIWSEPEFTEYKTRLNVINEVNDPLDLNVSWSNEIDWSSEYPVTITNPDDAAIDIQNAINEAYSNGGGVVTLPEGEIVTSGFKLKDRVALCGKGKEKTVLRLTGNTPYSVISGSGKIGYMGIYGMKIMMNNEDCDYYPDSVLYFPEDISHIFVKNVDFIMPILKHSDKDGRMFPVHSYSSDTIIDNIYSYGYYGGPYIVADNTVIKNSEFYCNVGKIYTIGSKIVLENNTIEIDQTHQISCQTEGIITRGPAFVARNIIKNSGKNVESNNDGETILTENAGGGTWFLGSVVNSSRFSTLVDIEHENSISKGETWGTYHIVIVSGKGVGQYRAIDDYNEDTKTIVVNEAWDIVPDSTSKFVVILPIKGTVLYKNEAYNSSKGYWFYRDNIDCVMYGNLSDGTSGCYIEAANLYINDADKKSGSFSVAYFNKLTDNTVFGASPKANGSAIGISGITWIDSDINFGTLVYGNEIKNNNYGGPGDENLNIDSTGKGIESPGINGIYIGHGVRTETPYEKVIKPFVRSTVVQGNRISNSDSGFSFGGNLYPNTWFYKHSYKYNGTTGVVLKDNTVSDTDREYVFKTNNDYYGAEDITKVEKEIMTGAAPEIWTNLLPVDKLSQSIINVNLQIKSKDSSGKNVKLICALFNGNTLKSVFTSEALNISGDMQEICTTVDLSDTEIEGCTLKCYIWTESGMCPLSDEVYKF